MAQTAAASRILTAVGIEIMHNQVATLLQELRNEEQIMADFARNVV